MGRCYRGWRWPSLRWNSQSSLPSSTLWRATSAHTLWQPNETLPVLPSVEGDHPDATKSLWGAKRKRAHPYALIYPLQGCPRQWMPYVTIREPTSTRVDGERCIDNYNWPAADTSHKISGLYYPRTTRKDKLCFCLVYHVPQCTTQKKSGETMCPKCFGNG